MGNLIICFNWISLLFFFWLFPFIQLGQNIFKAYANGINRVIYLSYIKEKILCRVKIKVSRGKGQFLIIHDELTSSSTGLSE